jgi:hypothetical protein
MGMTSGLNSWGISFVGGGNDPQGLSYKVFNLTSHPDHKYIWLRGGGVFFIAEYKTRPNDFDLQLVLVSCPKGQVKINVNVEACGKHL